MNVLFSLLLPVILCFVAFAADIPHALTLRSTTNAALTSALASSARIYNEGTVVQTESLRDYAQLMFELNRSKDSLLSEDIENSNTEIQVKEYEELSGIYLKVQGEANVKSPLFFGNLFSAEAISSRQEGMIPMRKVQGGRIVYVIFRPPARAMTSEENRYADNLKEILAGVASGLKTGDYIAMVGVNAFTHKGYSIPVTVNSGQAHGMLEDYSMGTEDNKTLALALGQPLLGTRFFRIDDHSGEGIITHDDLSSFFRTANFNNYLNQNGYLWGPEVGATPGDLSFNLAEAMALAKEELTLRLPQSAFFSNTGNLYDELKKTVVVLYPESSSTTGIHPVGEEDNSGQAPGGGEFGIAPRWNRATCSAFPGHAAYTREVDYSQLTYQQKNDLAILSGYENGPLLASGRALTLKIADDIRANLGSNFSVVTAQIPDGDIFKGEEVFCEGEGEVISWDPIVVHACATPEGMIESKLLLRDSFLARLSMDSSWDGKNGEYEEQNKKGGGRDFPGIPLPIGDKAWADNPDESPRSYGEIKGACASYYGFECNWLDNCKSDYFSYDNWSDVTSREPSQSAFALEQYRDGLDYIPLVNGIEMLFRKKS